MPVLKVLFVLVLLHFFLNIYVEVNMNIDLYRQQVSSYISDVWFI